MSKGKNAFLEKQTRIQDNFWNAGRDMGMQLAADCFQVVLNDPDVMGKDVFGSKRIKRICDEVQRRIDYYFDALDVRNPEADVMQEKLDAALRRLWGDELTPFPERYPMLKRCSYGGKKK